MILSNYSLTKTVVELRFHIQAHLTILNSLCFARCRAPGVILLHNPHEKKRRKEVRWGHGAQNSPTVLPEQLSCRFLHPNKACKNHDYTECTAICITVNGAKASKNENAESLFTTGNKCFKLNAHFTTKSCLTAGWKGIHVTPCKEF